MLSFESSSSGTAVATGPLPATTLPRVRSLPGLQRQPAGASLPPAPLRPVAPAGPVEGATINTSIFSQPATGGLQSPWSQPPTRPVTRPLTASLNVGLGTPAQLPEMESGIEGMRKLLFGNQMSDLQTRVAELQLSLHGEIKRMRGALMERIDEMSGYLHRDMVVLREETRGEMESVKTDLFTAATSISSLKDRVNEIGGKVRNELGAAIREVDERVTRLDIATTSATHEVSQRVTALNNLITITAGDLGEKMTRMDTNLASALNNVEANLRMTLDSRCANAFSSLARKSDMAAMLADIADLLDGPAEAFVLPHIPAPQPEPEQVFARLEGNASTDWMPKPTSPFLSGNHLTADLSTAA